MSTPFISIIMPTYGRANMLPRAVHAVRASTFTDWELIVIDDASPAADYAVKAEYINSLADQRVRIVQRETNGGCSAARNTGLTMARGEWVAYADDDDEMTPEWLTEIADIACHQQCDMILGDIVFDNKDARRVRPPAINVLRQGKICTGSFAHARRVNEQYGGWDESFPRYADDEVIYRYARLVGYDNIAVTPVIASHNHVGHQRLTTSMPSLDLVRRLHYANPDMWWTPVNNAVVICTSPEIEQTVLADDYHVGEFVDFTTQVQPDWWSFVPNIFKTANPVVGVITSNEPNIWPTLLCQLSRGCAYSEIPGGMATHVNSGEGATMVLRAAKRARTEKTAIS